MCSTHCVHLKLANINNKNCIGNATDGTANMQGQYNSFNTWLHEEAGTQLHTWCYAHFLNLVMMDITEKNHYSITLFGLLNSCAVFFSRILHTYEYFKRFTLRISYKNNICNSLN